MTDQEAWAKIEADEIKKATRVRLDKKIRSELPIKRLDGNVGLYPRGKELILSQGSSSIALSVTACEELGLGHLLEKANLTPGHVLHERLRVAGIARFACSWEMCDTVYHAEMERAATELGIKGEE